MASTCQPWLLLAACSRKLFKVGIHGGVYGERPNGSSVPATRDPSRSPPSWSTSWSAAPHEARRDGETGHASGQGGPGATWSRQRRGSGVWPWPLASAWRWRCSSSSAGVSFGLPRADRALCATPRPRPAAQAKVRAPLVGLGPKIEAIRAATKASSSGCKSNCFARARYIIPVKRASSPTSTPPRNRSGGVIRSKTISRSMRRKPWRRPPSPSSKDTTAGPVGMGGRKRRRPPSSVERSPQSIQPGTGSRASRSGMAGGTQEVETSGSMPRSVAPPSSHGEAAAGDQIGAQLVTPAPRSASTAGGGEELAAPTSPAGGEEVEDAAEDTDAGYFVPNSPLSMPCLEVQDSNGQVCEEPSDPGSDLLEPYWMADKKYKAKLREIRKLPTLDSDTATSPDITQESKADTILKASEFVLGLSSYTAGKLLRECSGILIEWSNGTGTILTTSKLIRTKSPNVDDWLGEDEYAPAEVCVQLLHKDGFREGKLMHLDKQYGFALFGVLIDEPKRLPHFCNEQFAQDVFLLGRYKLKLQIGNGKVLSKGTGRFERHHYMYTNGAISSFGAGGAVINFEGDVTGMIASPIHFIPSSIIIKCLEILKTYKCVPRVHLGMNLLGIKCLNLVSKEKIYREYDVDAGLIVQMVSTKSDAEKQGIRIGDIILSVNGKCIATAVELEKELLEISKAQLKKGTVPGSPNADVMLKLCVLNTTKYLRGKVQLSARLSNEEEILKEGQHTVICKMWTKVSSPDVSS